MDETALNEILIRQYGRSWRMFEEAVGAFTPRNGEPGRSTT